MLRWSISFLILALIAGVLGFGGIASASVDIAKILFFVFAVLFLISAIAAALRGRLPS
ncbi:MULTISPECIES: DUF1328 domain-containing protein [Alphaproteobacteria]|jgi:uncharacterized membrane protein YtjA (UPF0391 family)|uniref:DUF1328 domain-containing protein n=1 Tax=Alphaproteobacteria TaxID=28211 RepID=UPI00078C1450|nr:MULTISPECIES: DUF1328 domain-containing protein [Alphaproteobacteria]AMS28416.1 membrane protein [Hyphomonadaceae bacterium UKL13-1]MCE2892048.1 DUF1328 domain-containing protein [Hyphomonadaceae bacterium]OYU73097.1 MAG: DUF1328 domain-containing protein [Alphaproteobacteria bacterium PA3]MCA3693202.1 DUF1328 domain-containing protein [Aquidulcibacter sp.]MCA3696563.1 DUF1328 domain-containing protein [Aquidulcibacter sp.]